ncbi:hypothetical protein C2G38_2075966 [Gigaspora rosea]|uniref:Uncharacterized protein n=1 Tax=Gigaspora rosea TaxID=44941 RepID=A0A397VLR1_9GLOM|nr:hypothetical protein C2G38_2075966 [Gigaspora rosea]
MLVKFSYIKRIHIHSNIHIYFTNVINNRISNINQREISYYTLSSLFKIFKSRCMTNSQNVITRRI